MDPAEQTKRFTSAYLSLQLNVALKNVRPFKTISEFLENFLF